MEGAVDEGQFDNCSDSPPLQKRVTMVTNEPTSPEDNTLLNGYGDGEANCDSDVTEIVDLSSSSLDILCETSLNERLAKLVLDFNDLEALPINFGKLAPNLRVLSVNGNQLQTLPDSIGDFSHLEEMLLNENSLESLPDSFCKLKRLKVLKLTGNKIKNLPYDFGDLLSLMNLTIDENQLSTLPQTFGLLERLEIFEGNSNKIQDIPASFGRLKSLRILNLCSNKIESLPDNFGDLKIVEFLDLSSNQIEHLPQHFKSSDTLKKLYLDSNVISELPSWIDDLTQAVEVSVKDNKLMHQSVTEKFGHTNHKLKILNLSGNFMTSLPDSLGELTELEYLHLGSVIDELERRNFQNGNWISQLPKTFANMVNLKHLNLDENQIQELPGDFGRLVYLEFLDLGQNMLHELPESFGELRSLRICLLSKNHLQWLPSSFGSLSALEDVRVDNNLIAELPDSFDNLVQLKTLDLFNNKLTEIPQCIGKLTNLVRLDIEENLFGVPRQDIPMILRQSKYPPRDPALHDNWRGRPRQDLTGLENSIITMPVSDETAEDELKEDDDSVKFSERQLELAAWNNMSRSSSIWRSHEGPTQREKYVRSQSAFRSWLSRNQSFGSVTDGNVEREEDGQREEEREEEEEDDSYTMSFSSKIGDWGSASEEENERESCDTVPQWGDNSVELPGENWDEEVEEVEEVEDPFSSNMDAVEERQYPTWEEAHRPTKDLETLFFAFDLHPPSMSRDDKKQQPSVECGQFDDVDD